MNSCLLSAVIFSIVAIAVLLSITCVSGLQKEQEFAQELNLHLPTGLCQESAVAFNQIVTNVPNDKTYFLSFDLCKRTNLTAAFVNLIPCGFGQFQIAQLVGTNYNKSYNNTDCGRVFDNHTVLSRNDSLVITRYFMNSLPNSININYLELTINCVPQDIFIETFTIDVHNVSWSANSVLVNSSGVCQDAAPPNPAPKGTSPGVYIAIAFVLTFVALFATVLYRAKLAGDNLRELKRARGERAFLG